MGGREKGLPQRLSSTSTLWPHAHAEPVRKQEVKVQTQPALPRLWALNLSGFGLKQSQDVQRAKEQELHSLIASQSGFFGIPYSLV